MPCSSTSSSIITKRAAAAFQNITTAIAITTIFIVIASDYDTKLFAWLCAFSCPCAGDLFRGWPRARQTRRARRLSLRANTSSLMECGCRPSAGGRWRRSPTSRSEVATYGLSPTRSQVNEPLRHLLYSAGCLRILLHPFALCCSGDCRASLVVIKVSSYRLHKAQGEQIYILHQP